MTLMFSDVFVYYFISDCEPIIHGEQPSSEV